MKKILFTILLLTAPVAIIAQILEPVKWNTSVKKISENEYELIASASIDAGWHLYSQTVPTDGPIPTRFTFKGSPNYLKKGNTTEGKGHTVQDPIFEMEIKYFETKAEFKQRIKTLIGKPFNVEGTVEFMVCDDKRCLPPTEIDLTFKIN